MKEIKLIKPSDKIVGAVRVSETLFNKIDVLAQQEGVTKQDIIRAILENCIDDVKFN